MPPNPKPRPPGRRLRAAAAVLAGCLVGLLASATPAAAGAGFSLGRSEARPANALFDGGERIRLRYEFEARRPLDLQIKVVRASDGKPVRRWLARDSAPRREHRRRWDGRRANGKVAPDGRYEFRIGPPGRRGALAGRVVLRGHTFPIAGPHAYGDRFGEARSGGRVHEGQDLPAGCGTPLLAARGGRVAAAGYSDALYGYYVLIDGLATKTDLFYSHLQAPTPLGRGERVRTGERIGAVGKTGNARSEFCQLHFELWPRGYHRGGPVDPLGALRLWDSYS